MRGTGSDKLKHCTSSVFVFCKDGTEWKLLLVHHKKFGKWMIPGGHVEANENGVEAALRETKEETGCSPRLVSFIHETLPGVESAWLLPPEYLYEQTIPARKGEPEHYHIDSAYVGLVDSLEVQYAVDESNGIEWFTLEDVEKDKSMFLSTKNLALKLFGKLNNQVAFTFQGEEL